MPIHWIREVAGLPAVIVCGVVRRKLIGAQRGSLWTRGVLRWGLVLSIALTVSATFSVAAVPGGPRLAIIRYLPYPKSLTEIATINPVGGALQTVARDEGRPQTVGIVGSHPAFSPDGSLIAFVGSGPVVSVVGADGAGLRTLRNTFTEEEPIFAPDGHTIAYATLKVVGGHLERLGRALSRNGAYVLLGIRSVDIEDGSQHMVTPWRPDAALSPSSYSPDGSTLAVTAWNIKASTRAAVAVRLDGSGSTLLAKNAEEPVYSPDGSRIAFIRVHTHIKHSLHHKHWIERKDLYVMRADGSGLTRLTRSPRTLEAWPSWDPSGERIAFNTYRPAPARKPFDILAGTPVDTSVMQINADGTCLRKILPSRHRGLNGVAWQPGPGRGAGPIECGG
jgi:dipeptidyl aminopeptidase/acylaminoacyl peptidase